MAECSVSEVNKNINSSFKQLSDVPICQEFKIKEVMEPLLLEDFQKNKIPSSLVNIQKVFEDRGVMPSKTDFLAGCVYVLMLEYGFIPHKRHICISDSEFNYSRIKEISYGSSEIISQGSNKINDNFSCSFVLPPDELYVCNISCIKIGDDLIINASVRNVPNANFTVMLDISTYFTDGANQYTTFERVQNMRALSTLFKNEIAFPIKHTVLRILGQRHPCLEDLPVELIHHIFKYIHGIDIVRMTSTCKHFYSLRQDVRLWKYLLKRDYSISSKADNYKKLFENYGSLYKRRTLNSIVWPNMFHET